MISNLGPWVQWNILERGKDRSGSLFPRASPGAEARAMTLQELGQIGILLWLLHTRVMGLVCCAGQWTTRTWEEKKWRQASRYKGDQIGPRKAMGNCFLKRHNWRSPPLPTSLVSLSQQIWLLMYLKRNVFLDYYLCIPIQSLCRETGCWWCLRRCSQGWFSLITRKGWE